MRHHAMRHHAMRHHAMRHAMRHGFSTPWACARAGVLMVIDLAGSERAADSKGHDKQRMEETKAVNLSLMALKDCIRARTLASTAGAGEQACTHHCTHQSAACTLRAHMHTASAHCRCCPFT